MLHEVENFLDGWESQTGKFADSRDGPCDLSVLNEIRGFRLIPGINIVDIIKALSSESLKLVVTVRGQKAYKEIEVTIKMTTPVNWTVVSSEEINRK